MQGVAPTTWVFDASKLADLMADVDKAATGIDYRPTVGWLTKQFVNAKRRDERSEFPSLGIAFMWSALHHPQSGEMMRAKVSEVLRRDGKAHISWHSPTAGLAIGWVTALRIWSGPRRPRHGTA